MEEITFADFQKVDFGPYKKEPIKHFLRLLPEEYWIINHPTSEDEVRRYKYISSEELCVMDIALYEISLLFGGCSLKFSNGVSLSGLITAPMDIKLLYFGSLPSEFILEIWEAMGEIPNWGPATSGE